MVVAELPLWLVHTSNSSGGTATTTVASEYGNFRPAASFNPRNVKLSAARDALRTLNPPLLSNAKISSTGTNTDSTTGAASRNKKCAIYSIDVIPNGRIFATAGGDGKVRLWNSRALFASSAARSNQGAIMAHYDAKTGAYVSSETSAAASSEEEDETTNKNGLNKKHTQSPFADDDEFDETPLSTQQQPLAAQSPAAAQVHDLNAVVRRKKDGMPVPSKAAALTGAAQGLASPLSRTDDAAMQSPTSPTTTTATASNTFYPSHHRLLCTLSAHTGSSVLAVRFSTSGEYLASAGDDACVCIYAPSSASTHPAVTGNLVQQANDATATAGGSSEPWARIKLCRGHGLDVVDLAWAPDDSHLVSCSLDSATPIIVWKLNNLDGVGRGGSAAATSMICAPFKVLGQSIHTSTVKGVTFDPAGSYLASSGDDPAVCIWRAHDDWGLEKRIDADSGIFRKWASSATASAAGPKGNEGNENGNQSGEWDDIQGLSNQSLFRRLSWSTDGAFVCSTNSIVKHKHVASAISREGWTVSGGSSSTSSSAAANLVGHKQPVIASRHSMHMLNTRQKRSKKGDGDNSSNGDDDESTQENDEDDGEPEYATLLALGDRRGFVTVWSTHKSRPVFKLQCSESHCTVTDLAWGSLRNGDLMLLVSLLDGQVVAIRFSVPNELGPLLTKKEKARVFQLRYGIDLYGSDETMNEFGQRRLFVGGHSRPKLIENPLQIALERMEDGQTNDVAPDEMDLDDDGGDELDESLQTSSRSTKEQQQETVSQGGKKRIRPVLMETIGRGDKSKRSKSMDDASSRQKQKAAAASDPLQSTMEAAERAVAAATEGASAARTNSQRDGERHGPGESEQVRSSPGRLRERSVPAFATYTHPIGAAIPHNTDRVHSVDLPPISDAQATIHEGKEASAFSVECVNVNKVPTGSKGAAIPCIDISLTSNGRATWKDQIPGTCCSAVAASRQFLAVGTSDGSVQLFGASPTLGWSSGSSFRSHPPLIFGQAIVTLQLKESQPPEDVMTTDTEVSKVSMLVISSDGSFGVWSVIPELCLEYKGTLMPVFVHMSLSLLPGQETRFPKLARAQIAESDRLLLLLSFDTALPTATRIPQATMGVGVSSTTRLNQPSTDGPGGSLQGFVYDKRAELWMRMSDSRFILSDFYSALPASTTRKASLQKNLGVLSQMDDAVRVGCLQSSLKGLNRGGGGACNTRLGEDRYHADEIYEQAEEEFGNFLVSRAHCEDRMACALALRSSSEFRHWLGLYVKTLAMKGHASQLRLLVDMLLTGSTTSSRSDTSNMTGCWWLSRAATILNEDRKAVIKSIVIPEMSKNRALQRITNEIALEVDNV